MSWIVGALLKWSVVRHNCTEEAVWWKEEAEVLLSYSLLDLDHSKPKMLLKSPSV